MKTLFLGIVLFYSTFASAQDYVVTQKNDTIKGKVKLLTYDRLDRIDISKGKIKQHFTCLQLKAVYSEGATFNTIRTDNGYRLMKLETPGFLSLYLARKPTGFLYDTEMLVKKDGSSTEIPGLSFKKILANFLADCPTVVERIKQEELTRKNIPEVVNEYNKCVDAQTRFSNLNSSAIATNPILIALTNLKTKIEASSLPTQKDALDILKDIMNKVVASQTIPNYLMEGFKENVKSSPELLEEFDKVLVMIGQK